MSVYSQNKQTHSTYSGKRFAILESLDLDMEVSVCALDMLKESLTEQLDHQMKAIEKVNRNTKELLWAQTQLQSLSVR